MDEIKRGATLWIEREDRDKAHLNLKSSNLIWDDKDKKEVVIFEFKFRFEFGFGLEVFKFESERICLGDNNLYPLHSPHLNSLLILSNKMRRESRWGNIRQSLSALTHLIRSNVYKRASFKWFDIINHRKNISMPPFLFSTLSPSSIWSHILPHIQRCWVAYLVEFHLIYAKEQEGCDQALIGTLSEIRSKADPEACRFI